RATTRIHTLSLHDALPISERGQRRDLFLYFRDARGERREQSSPGGGRGDVAGGAREEPYAHARFELLDRVAQRRLRHAVLGRSLDRKSTRLNSSHVKISYA